MKLNEKQLKYLKEISEMLAALDVHAVSTFIDYEREDGTKRKMYLTSIKRDISKVLSTETYHEWDQDWLNQLKYVYYELKELIKNPVNIRWEFTHAIHVNNWNINNMLIVPELYSS